MCFLQHFNDVAEPQSGGDVQRRLSSLQKTRRSCWDLLTQQKLCVVERFKDVRRLGCGCRRVSAAAEGPGDGSSSHRRSAELCSPSGEKHSQLVPFYTGSTAASRVAPPKAGRHAALLDHIWELSQQLRG